MSFVRPLRPWPSACGCSIICALAQSEHGLCCYERQTNGQKNCSASAKETAWGCLAKTTEHPCVQRLLLQPRCDRLPDPWCMAWPPSVWPPQVQEHLESPEPFGPTALGRLEWAWQLGLAGFSGPTCYQDRAHDASLQPSHLRPKNKGFVDLNPDPCLSNHQQLISHH